MTMAGTLLTSLACLYAGAPIAATAEGPSLAALLPDETLFYVSGDVERLIDGVRQLDVARLLQDPEMKDFLAPLYEALPAISKDDPVGSVWSMAPIREYVTGEVSFGFSGVGFEVEDADGSTRWLRISPNEPLSARLFHELASYQESHRVNGAVHTIGQAPCERIALDFLAAVEPGPRLKEHVRGFLADPPAFTEVGEVTMGGRPIRAINFTLPDSGGIKTTIYADLSGDRWLIGGAQPSFAAALKGGPARSLAGSKSYNSFSSRLISGGHEALFAFFDFATALKTIRSLVPPIVMEELEINGLDAFRGIGLGLSIRDGGVRESLLLSFDGARPGVFSVFDAIGGGFPGLAEAPASTAAYVGLRFDPNRLKDDVSGLAHRLFPRLGDAFDRVVDDVSLAGMNLTRDILPAFGSELSVCLSRPRNGPIPEALLTLGVQDVEKFGRLLAFGREIAASEGAEISELPLTDGDAGFVLRLPDAPVQPAFVVRDHRLIGAISAFTLRNHLNRHVNNPAAKTLGQASEVMPRVLEGLTGDAADSLALLAYLDLHSTIPILYETAAPYMQPAFDEAGIPLDAALLPMPETVQEYLTGVAIGLTSDDHGIGVHAFTPTGILPTALTALILEQMSQRPSDRKQVYWWGDHGNGAGVATKARKQGDSD